MSSRQRPFFYHPQSIRFSPQNASTSHPIYPTLPHNEQRRLLQTISTLDFHRQNAAKLDAVVRARACQAITIRDMGRMYGTPIVVMNKELGQFAMDGFHCLRILGYQPPEILSYIADGFQSLDPRVPFSTVRQQVMEVHAVLAQLARGCLLAKMVYSGGLGPDVTLATANLRMALYCARVAECIEEWGIGRATFYHIMANAKLGIPLKQSFLELGISGVVRPITSRLANVEHTAPVHFGYLSSASASGSGSGSGSGARSPYLCSSDVSSCTSESSYTSNGSFNPSRANSECDFQRQQQQEEDPSQVQSQAQTIPSIHEQCKNAVADIFEDLVRDSYEWKFLCEAHQAFYDQAKILREDYMMQL